MKIQTNYHRRPFLYGHEVPEDVQLQDYDHLAEDDRVSGWICYRGQYYHVSDFLRIPYRMGVPEHWQAYLADSFFSGVLLHVSEDGERYQIATFYG